MEELVKEIFSNYEKGLVSSSETFFQLFIAYQKHAGISLGSIGNVEEKCDEILKDLSFHISFVYP